MVFCRENIQMRREEIETTLGEGVRQNIEGVVQMEDWLKVLALTESWSRELDMAESGARQLDDALTVLDRKVCKVETELAGWINKMARVISEAASAV